MTNRVELLNSNWMDEPPEIGTPELMTPRWQVGDRVWTNEAVEVLKEGGSVFSVFFASVDMIRDYPGLWTLRDGYVYYMGVRRARLSEWASADFPSRHSKGMEYQIHSLPTS